MPSIYNSFNDLEENVSAKKVAEEAKLFWLDKSKPLNERVKAFEKYGDAERYLHHSKHPEVERQYKNLYESGCYGRYETINTLDILDNVDAETPEEEQRQRVELTEVILEEGIAKFVIDW